MPFPKDASAFWWFLHFLIRAGVGPLLCRLTVEGREHVPPDGGCVAACNHSIGPDYVALGYAASRQVYYLAKSDIFGLHPLLDRFLFAVGTFPIKRGQQDGGAIRASVELVESGKVLGMFPEGTRSRDGILGEGKSGAARIAIEAGVPILPVVVLNSDELFQRMLGRRWRRPHVTVRFGPVIYPDPDNHAPDYAKTLTHQVMVSMARLMPEERRGIYATEVAELIDQAKTRTRTQAPEYT